MFCVRAKDILYIIRREAPDGFYGLLCRIQMASCKNPARSAVGICSVSLCSQEKINTIQNPARSTGESSGCFVRDVKAGGTTLNLRKYNLNLAAVNVNL